MLRQMKTISICLVVLVFSLTSCVTDIEDPVPPSAPSFVLPDAVQNFPKSGTRVKPGINSLVLVVHSPGETDISSIGIWRSLQKFDHYERIGSVSIGSSDKTNSFEDTSVSPDTSNYYYLKAIDYGQNESSSSDTLRFLVLQPAQLQQFDEPVSLNPAFQWTIDPPESAAGFFILEIADHNQNPIYRSELLSRLSYGGTEFWTLQEDTLQNGQQYFWRIYAFGLLDYQDRPHAMSLSQWSSFTVRE